MRVVELITDDDVWAVRELASMHHQELGEGRSFATASVVQSAFECRSQAYPRMMNCWIVYTDTGKPIGYLAATAQQWFHSPRRSAMQQMFYVVPEYRGAKAALLLVRAYEQWARELNCEVAFMMVEHNTEGEFTDRIGEFYTKVGFTKRGAIHIKNLED